MPVSPKLEWTNVPANTESFVLIMHDPDNALNKGTDDVLHWMTFNIPGTARGLAGGLPTDATLPDGTIQAKNIREWSAIWVRATLRSIRIITTLWSFTPWIPSCH